MIQRKSRAAHDIDLQRFIVRGEHREKRHGNWRQVFLDCSGLCVYEVEPDVTCSELDGLEFHEIFRETKKGENKFQQRVLLCNYHHWSVHGEKWVNVRHYPSMLQTDVTIELYLCGGLVEWIAKFNLIDRRVKHDIKMQLQGDKSDLSYSEVL